MLFFDRVEKTKKVEAARKKAVFIFWELTEYSNTSIISIPGISWHTSSKPLQTKVLEPQLPELQAMRKHYPLSVDSQKFPLLDCSPRYEDTVASYTAYLVKMV